MAKHIQIGQNGEDLAERHLLQRGYRIICRNWRYKRTEVDFIAEDQGVLVFVEVKTRSGASFGMPYEAVGWAKEQQLAKAAGSYIRRSGHRGDVRFDIVSIVLPASQAEKPDILLIKDAFWPR